MIDVLVQKNGCSVCVSVHFVNNRVREFVPKNFDDEFVAMDERGINFNEDDE